MRRLTCRSLACRFPRPRTAQEQEYRLNWIAAELSAGALETETRNLERQADSHDEDRDGLAELGGVQSTTAP